MEGGERKTSECRASLGYMRVSKTKPANKQTKVKVKTHEEVSPKPK